MALVCVTENLLPNALYLFNRDHPIITVTKYKVRVAITNTLKHLPKCPVYFCSLTERRLMSILTVSTFIFNLWVIVLNQRLYRVIETRIMYKAIGWISINDGIIFN